MVPASSKTGGRPPRDDTKARRNRVGQAGDRPAKLGRHGRALGETYEYLYEIANNIDQGLWIWTADPPRVVYTSDVLLGLWGIEPGTIMAKPGKWLALVDPCDREALSELLPKSLDGPGELEYRVHRAGGAVRWLYTRTFPLREATGRVRSVVGITDDVTERKRSAELQRLVTSLATGFVQAPVDQLGQGIERALERIGRFCGADRAGVFLWDDPDSASSLAFHWSAEGNEPLAAEMMEQPPPTDTWAGRRALRGEVVHVHHLDERPDDATFDREFSAATGIESFLNVPLVSAERGCFGCVALANARSVRAWSAESLSILEVAAETIANVIERKRLEEERQRAQRELARRNEFEGLVGRVATGFIKLPVGELDPAILSALGELGTFLRADRAAVFVIEEDREQIRYLHEWCSDPSFEVARESPTRLLADLPLVAESLATGQILNVPSIAALEGEMTGERGLALELGIRSRVQIPLTSGDEVIGGLVFVTVTEERNWADDDMAVLRVAAETFANALARRRAEAQRERHSQLQRLIADLATEFVNLPVEAIDDGIVRALARLGAFVGSDQATILRFDGEPDELPRVYQWRVDGLQETKSRLESIPIDTYPWLTARLARPEPLEIHDVSELPEVAAADREFLAEFGVRSVIDTPLISGSVCTGILVFTSRKPSKPRTAEFLSMLKVAAEMFSNALARKELHLEHSRLARRNQLILDAAGEGVYGLDLDGRATFVNWAAAEMLGWTPAELVGSHAHDVFHHTRVDGSAYPAEQCPIYAAYRECTTRTVDDEVFWRKDGTSFPVEYVGSPLLEDGRPAGAVVVFRDIGARKAAQDERDHHADLERVITMLAADFINRPVDELDEGIEEALDELRSICDVDRTSVLLLTDDQTELRLIYESLAEGEEPSTEVLGGLPRAVDEWTVRATAAREVVSVNSAAELPPEADFERKIMHMLGVRSYISVPMVTGRTVLGTVMFATGSAERRWSDETRTLLTIAAEMFANAIERKRIEEETRQHRDALAHALRVAAMGELATGLAHELNQPLAAISNYARGSHRRLERGVIDPPELMKTVDQISHLALRAGAVIRGMRSHVSRDDTSRRRHGIAMLIAEAVSLIVAEVRRSDVALDTRMDIDAAVQVDRIQIEQVILNLIRNGIESIEGGGNGQRKIVVSSRQLSDETIEVAVADSGRGIEADSLGKLFDQFYTTKEGGLGLGLSISKSIVSAHGGKLWAETNADGGATFRFTLPLVRLYPAGP